MRTLLMPLALMLLTSISLSPQAGAQTGEKKPLSPPAKTETSIDGNRIAIQYSAPSMRGRKIMGGLVPFDKVWRTGANAATTLVTETDLRIGDLQVPRGTYTLYTVPTAKAWTLIINRQTGQWGTQYDATQDLGRVPMTMTSIPEPLETFAISLDSAGKQGMLRMRWENTEATVGFEVLRK